MTLPTSPTQPKPPSSAPPFVRANGAKPAAAGPTTCAAPANNGVAAHAKPPISPPAAKAPAPASTDALLARIAAALERLAVNTPAPNYKRGLAAYKTFDFARLCIRVGRGKSPLTHGRCSCGCNTRMNRRTMVCANEAAVYCIRLVGRA